MNHSIQRELFLMKEKLQKQMVLAVLILLILFIKSLYNKIPHSLIIEKTNSLTGKLNQES